MARSSTGSPSTESGAIAALANPMRLPRSIEGREGCEA